MAKKYIIYIAFFFIICLIPSVGTIFSGGGSSDGDAGAAKKPSIVAEEGGPNARFLSDAGDYFEDNFAFRNVLVTGYSFLADKLFGVSATDGVIVGTDGWLYYKDSLNDYQGAGQMTDGQLADFARSLKMIEEYAEKRGIAFVFAVAPNKNSLYGEHMPYYYSHFRSEKSNLSRLVPYLSKEGVNFADLFTLLDSKSEILYYERDSHWNAKGASMAADAILTALGKEHVSYADRKYDIRKDNEGDLDRMLYPSAITKEAAVYFDPMPRYGYVDEIETNFDPKIRTKAPGVAGSLVMYRDSFGSALLPFMAEAYGKAYFSRAVPFQLSDLDDNGADALVIECAERFLPDIAESMPDVLSQMEGK